MSSRDPELKKELDATVETRKELGDAYETELIESFLEKLEERIDATVDKRVRRQLAEQQLLTRGSRRSSEREDGSGHGPGPAFALAVLSLVLAIPLSAIGAVNLGLPGLLVAWAGIVGVNYFYSTLRH
ncbi:hypothetical protein [Streptomyces sp. YIM 98790]|uniref:hypothetical protein n=1 Tax=Streptomyces sp. YIM 98790 TaxID=2689077 RepID=UPI0014086D92|nr:hypothetical protein [Streptomyces sp. YIM 98790]